MKTFILFLLLTSSSLAEVLFGTARNSEGELVYTEEHLVERDAGDLSKKIETSYFDKDGKKIAKLISEFSDKPSAPNSKFEDFRFNRIFEGKFEKKGGKEFYKISELNADKLTKVTELSFRNDLVSGPGFDNYIKENLMKKKLTKSSVHFLVLPRHDYYKFDVIDNGLTKDELDHEYIIKPSFVVSLFVKEIKISYDAKTGFLKKYVGLSNLPSSKDASQSVTIDYQVKSPVGSKSP
jgi:hypothetical protein